ncbi:MAG: type II secretion system F family protein [Eggerthellaceae bacterium]|nr:type II secretion system F family protein [Eggerthellaceae bacterium]
MEAPQLLTVIAAVGAALFACVGAVTLARVAMQQAARSRLRAAGSGEVAGKGVGGVPGAGLRGGVRVLLPMAAGLRIRIAAVDAFAGCAVDVLARRGVAASEDAVISAVMAGAMAGGCLVGLCSWSLFWGCMAAVAVAAAAVVTVSSLQAKDAERLREQMPEVLRALRRCLESGMTLEQTFTQIASECDGQFAVLFGDASRMLATGCGSGEALAHIRSHCAVPEMTFLAVALDVQHRTGGSMGSVLDAAQKAVTGRLDLARQLKVQTAQARLSARVVTVLPFALLAVLSLLSPGFLDPLFDSPVGWIVLGFAILLQVGGIVWVRSILREVAR